MRTLNLRQLILLLSMSTALLILANTFYTSHQTQRALLIEQTLEANRAYALKTASNANSLLVAAQQQLAFAAGDVLLANGDTGQLQHIAERLKQQTDSFSSTVITDPHGTALAITQPAQDFLGRKLDSTGATQALTLKKPLISKPYISMTDHLMVFLTHPVFDAQGVYLGFVGGSIYLDAHSVLTRLIGEHYHAQDASVYVVNAQRRVIYHQDPAWVGEFVQSNAAIEQVIQQRSGSMQLVNTKGIEMLAGYAPVTSSGWGVVVQRSLQATLADMNQQMLVVAQYSFPFFIVIMIVLWVVSRWITKPLWQLAQSAKALDAPDASRTITAIDGWYFEAFQIKNAILQGLASINRKMGKLNLENITDPLTNLVNRRGMEIALDEWQALQQPFAVIMADIDHFKVINDSYGHDIGDEVLQFLAQQLHDLSRPDDIVCRFGGEEFVVLLPKVNTEQAYKVAERLRIYMENTNHPRICAPITLSFGVASWPSADASIAQVMKQADTALYAAKAAGRNQVQSSPVV